MRKLLAAALLCLCLNADAVTVRVALSVNPDGTRDTAFPNGDKPIGGSACSTFTCDDIGDAAADINEDSATQVTIATTGTTDSTRSIGIAYKTVASGNDIQVDALIEDVADWIGPVENYTQFGVGISESIAQDGYFAHCFWPGISNARFKRGSVGSIADSTGESGSAPVYVRLAYDVSATDLICSHSFDGETYTQTGPTQDKTLTCDPNCQAYVYGVSHSGDVVTSTISEISISTTLDDPPEEPDPEEPGPRQGIVYTADWETGGVQKRNDGLHDGGFYNGMAPPLNGTCTALSTLNGNVGGVNSNHYTRVVDSSVIEPYGGDYSLRFMLQKNCDYNAINGGVVGDIGGSKDKARSEFHTSALKAGKSDEELPFDAYVWLGWGSFFPNDFEEEEENNHDMPIFEITGANSAVTFHLDTGYEFWIGTQFSSTSTQMSSPEAGTRRATLDISDYLGRWVPYVCRVRMNPFTGAGPHSTAGISGSTGQSYAGDRGNLECWIDEVKVVDFQGPLGPVPKTDGWWTIHEFYKGGWKKRATSMEGPIVYYMDELRIGIESRGAGYEDVHPEQTACSDDCP